MSEASHEGSVGLRQAMAPAMAPAMTTGDEKPLIAGSRLVSRLPVRVTESEFLIDPQESP